MSGDVEVELRQLAALAPALAAIGRELAAIELAEVTSIASGRGGLVVWSMALRNFADAMGDAARELAGELDDDAARLRGVADRYARNESILDAAFVAVTELLPTTLPVIGPAVTIGRLGAGALAAVGIGD